MQSGESLLMGWLEIWKRNRKPTMAEEAFAIVMRVCSEAHDVYNPPDFCDPSHETLDAFALLPDPWPYLEPLLALRRDFDLTRLDRQLLDDWDFNWNRSISWLVNEMVRLDASRVMARILPLLSEPANRCLVFDAIGFCGRMDADNCLVPADVLKYLTPFVEMAGELHSKERSALFCAIEATDSADAPVWKERLRCNVPKEDEDFHYLADTNPERYAPRPDDEVPSVDVKFHREANL